MASERKRADDRVVESLEQGDGKAGRLAEFSNVLFGAGILLLLPRQWVSAGIAFALAGGLHLLAKRARGTPPPAP